MRPFPVVLAIGTLALLDAELAHAWQTFVAGTPPASRPLAITVDAAGDVVAAGRVVAPGGDDGLVAKLAGADGSELWQRTLPGSAAATDQLRDVATDASRNVVVVGQAANATTGGDALVAKYDADGMLAWRLDLDGGADGQDDAIAVTVDGAGDVLFAGIATASVVTGTQFSVSKRAGADGDVVWQNDLAGAPGAGRAIVLAGADVFAAGDVGDDIVVVRLAAATGVQGWRANVTGGMVANDIGRALAVGGGRVAVAGRMVTESGGNDFAVVAIDASNGMELWRHVVDGSAVAPADADDAFGVAIDQAGDVIAVGRVSDATSDDDIVVMKLAAATGAEVWRTTINGGNDNDDDAQAVALDAAGDVLVAGSIRNPMRGRDVFVGKFAGATGAEVWRREVNGSESAADVGSVVAVTADGDLVGGGRLQNGDAADGLVILKRTGANGGDFPCADGTEDPGEGCDDGNVVPGDGCRADCTAEICGDGIPDPQEACDDGNALDGDCCSATCAAEADASPCDDGDACTLGDACAAARCVPASLLVCVPESPCHLATCNPATGACTSTLKANGAPCDDENACTALDRCIDRVCSGSIAPTCEDADPCTLDRCDPAAGCVADPLSGFPSVSCVLERRDIAVACDAGVPSPIARQLERIDRFLDQGAATEKTRRARRALGRAIASMKRALRLVEKRRRRQQVTPTCADGLATTLGELVTRSGGLRELLAGS